KWWPLIYAPVVELGAETWRSCHLKCLLDALRRDEEHPRAAGVETSFGESVLELVTRAEKALFSRKPSARLGLEDERMCLAAQSTLPPTWPYEELRPIPKATFFLQGVLELRLSCSPQLVEIPPNLGRSTDLESLCLISNSLTSLPSEVGMLRELRFLYLNGNFLRRIPQAVSDLPKLQEICFDANCLEELPHFTAQLRLFTAPGNHLTEVAFWPQLERLEVHGNRLQRLLPLSWHSTSQLVTLKVMGNQLTELPEEVGHMPVLRILGVASNR
ncbi:Plant intracellular Ras-group-related LRR protein 2, partial [Durusdinium trenchii]